ncbi:hypothetical protein SAMN05443999_11816 [Roseovarius azorensis]|uniref:Apple domain-containing protein n=1 Tax=Roseovarius azorensis TaxID=1287727 RepID=A0A1H7X379_9RHOB|nr:ATP-dependent Clp protease proteolytic subunit [Roseovarius azorensis]SEM27559.1 hypothetical protein SAMN05443999_11816 [Roseovarius azorensis]
MNDGSLLDTFRRQKRHRFSACSFFFHVFLLLQLTAATAANISFEDSYLGPFGRSVHVHVDGELRTGDTNQIREFVGALRYSDDLRIHVNFNSPGGSLAEGLEIGRYLASLPVTVTTSVSREEGQAGECASACVFAYIGGHYRYLGKDSRIGVHQFYLGEDAKLSASEGVAISQVMAGEIVTFLDENRVRPDFFKVISTVAPDQIHWVPETALREFRVVTGPIYDQATEFRHVDGHYYLRLWQQSYYGESKMIATCANPGEMVFSSYIQPADIHSFDHRNYTFEITINGVSMPPASWEPGPRDARWAVTSLTLQQFQLDALRSASSFGARHVHESGVFLGFEFALEDSRLAELVAGCRPRVENQSQPITSKPLMSKPTLLDQPTILRNNDIPGGDFDTKGLREISIDQCHEVCLGIDRCIGFSWVEQSGWCWPKHTISSRVSNTGVTSVIIRR